MKLIELKEFLGLLLAVAVIGGRFYLLEERVEMTRETCAKLTVEIEKLRIQLDETRHQKETLPSPVGQHNPGNSP
jgi:hypothetical protein